VCARLCFGVFSSISASGHLWLQSKGFTTELARD
jgi:hypothetical protein